MKKSCLLFLFCFFVAVCLTGQSVSDSLHNTKFYPVHDGSFILIGSEKPGSFRKSVIRLYDSDLKVIKEIRQRKARSSDIFLDEILPNEYRIIDRYRWNKGRVKLYNKKLELKSSVFFKRDDYKDWSIKTDEYLGYPLRFEEHVYGLDPIFFTDSFCFFFDRDNKNILVTEFNFSMIKPVFHPYAVIQTGIDSKINVDSYSFKRISNEKIIFFYALAGDTRRVNHFIIADVSDKNNVVSKHIDLMNSNYELFVSDFSFNEKKQNVLLAGGYTIRGNNTSITGEKGMDGYFLMSTSGNGQGNIQQFIPNNEKDTDKMIGYKVSEIKNDDFGNRVWIEKFSIKQQDITSQEKGGLKGSYYKIFPEKMVRFQYSDKAGEALDFIDFNFLPDQFKNNDYRIFNIHKAQTLPQIMFNGNGRNPNFNTSLIHSDETQQKVIYKDRHDNYFCYSFISEETKLIFENREKANCYFFDGFYIQYVKSDWGYTIHRISY